MSGSFRVVNRAERFHGPVFDLLSDEVTMPDGGTATRDWIRHLGAVGVVAIDDTAGQGAERVLFVRQYRHPVGRELWELPAGLLDVAGEKAVTSAARELAEEADLTAGQYEVLVDLLTTPGGSDEAIRLYLARDLAPVPLADRHERVAEESTMTTRWFLLDEAVTMVLAGEIENSVAAAGVLAAAVARGRGWQGLRSADAGWPARPDR